MEIEKGDDGFIQFSSEMSRPDSPELGPLDMKNRILHLEEQMLTQQHRIVSLEWRIRHDSRSSNGRFADHEKEIASLKDALAELDKANTARLAEQTELATRISNVEAIQRDQAVLAALPDVQKEQQHRLDSFTDELGQLKTALIENTILPELIISLGAAPLDGIISHLTRECGGNVADRGIVGITAKSVANDSRLPRNAADFESPVLFLSKYGADQWIEWDFKSSQIETTHYSILTHGGESGGRHLRFWVLEGRNADEEWIVLDERNDDSQLNGRNRLVTFEIQTRMRVRNIRLRQTGVNHRGDSLLMFFAVEFFGRFFRTASVDWRLHCIRSLAGDFSGLKTELIENAILPERFIFSRADPLDGIISHLTWECGGNVADQGIVVITAKSVVDDCHLPRNAADVLSDAIFETKGGSEQWIEWDFKSSHIEATHYSIRTHGGASGSSHLRFWILEGRNADEEWIVLDKRNDDSQLNGKGRLVTFEIHTRMRVRKIRLRQTGVTHRGDEILAFGAVEFFGRFFRGSSLRCRCDSP
jgi:hypothetical protein